MHEGLEAIDRLARGIVPPQLPSLLARLETLLETIPEHTRTGARYRARLEELLDAVDESPKRWAAVPEPVTKAAQACRGPVPRAIAGGGMRTAFTPRVAEAEAECATARWSHLDSRWSDPDAVAEAVRTLVRDTEAIDVVVILDRVGLPVAGAGKVGTLELEASKRAERALRRGDGVSLDDDGAATIPPVTGDDQGVHLRTIDGRLLMKVGFHGAEHAGAVEAETEGCARALRERAERFPEIRDEDFGGLLSRALR
jgi:hypothetical protein